MLNVHYNIFFV